MKNVFYSKFQIPSRYCTFTVEYWDKIYSNCILLGVNLKQICQRQKKIRKQIGNQTHNSRILSASSAGNIHVSCVINQENIGTQYCLKYSMLRENIVCWKCIIWGNIIWKGMLLWECWFPGNPDLIRDSESRSVATIVINLCSSFIDIIELINRTT